MQESHGAHRTVDAVETAAPEPLIAPDARREIEAALTTFRQWLLDAEVWRDRSATSGEDLPDRESVDLHSVLREWIALKQELKLEARGSKAARKRLDDAVEAFHGGVDHVAGETKGLLDAVMRERDRLRDEARTLRESEAQSWVAVLLDVRDLIARVAESSQRTCKRRRWRRWFRKAQSADGLHEGYVLALRQVDAALEARGIRPITCERRPVDPHSMRVVDVVQREDVPPGHVVEVIRPGYVWGSRTIRYAEVRAAAATERESEGEAHEEAEAGKMSSDEE